MAAGINDKLKRIFRGIGTARSGNYKSNEYFIRNGRCLLEESISFFDGRTNPIRCLSIEELDAIAVDHSCVFHVDGFAKVYRSVWEGRSVLLKLYDNNPETEHVCRDIVVSTQMGTQANALKLLACCLETEYPVVVFEGLVNGSLERRLRCKNQHNQQLEWKDKLRITYEVAYALAYLHTAFPTPIIYRDLKPGKVFLDQDGAATLYDFSLCLSIPKGKSYLKEERLVGTFGYLAPEYAWYGKLAESSDVYSFGMLLLALFTEESSVHLVSLVSRALDNDISEASTSRKDGKISDFQMQAKMT